MKQILKNLVAKLLSLAAPKLAPMLAWMKPRKQKLLIAGIVGLALLLVGFALGRHTAPAHVLKQTVTQTITNTVYKDRIVTQTHETVQKAEDKVRVVTVFRDRVVKADGSSEERTAVKAQTETASKAEIAKLTARTEDKAQTQTQTITKTQTIEVDRRPNWNVSLLVGARPGGFQLSPPFVAKPQFGIAANYRVLGPFTIGGYFLAPPSATGGLSLGVEF